MGENIYVYTAAAIGFIPLGLMRTASLFNDILLPPKYLLKMPSVAFASTLFSFFPKKLTPVVPPSLF